MNSLGAEHEEERGGRQTLNKHQKGPNGIAITIVLRPQSCLDEVMSTTLDFGKQLNPPQGVGSAEPYVDNNRHTEHCTLLLLTKRPCLSKRLVSSRA